VAFLLTTASEARQALGLNTDKHDAYLERLIPGVSAMIARFLNRVGDDLLADGLERRARVETLDVEPLQRQYRVSAGPLVTLTDVRYDPLRTFGTESIINSENVTIRSRPMGELWIDFALVAQKRDRGVQTLQVSYTGGMFADLDEMRVQAPELELACQQQMHAILQSQKIGPMRTSVSGQGGSVNRQELTLLAIVKDLIRHLRRPAVGN